MITKVAFLLLMAVNACWASGCAGGLDTSGPKEVDANSVEAILKQLKQKTAELKSYQSQIEYSFRQPLLESETKRRGVLYYKKEADRSRLRINFQTLKQDDEEEQKYVEHYIFDGVWLTYIDYHIKQVKRYQQAEPNEPADAFELAGRNFPIIGFTKVEDLKKEFEIKLVEQQKERPENLIQLYLKVRPDSIYKDDYTSIEFWLDKRIGLPARIVAVSTEEDVYEIKFLKPKVNESIDGKVFEFKIPKGFGKPEIIPLNVEGK